MGDLYPDSGAEDRKLQREERERLEVLSEIDKIVENNRLPLTSERTKLKPKKMGAVFPLLINILAVAAVAGTIYFSDRMFSERQDQLYQTAKYYQSAEGRLLEQLKEDSEKQLKAKDSEIAAILSELEELDRQSRELELNMQQTIAEREAALRAALTEELRLEKEKLESQGQSEDAVSEQLAALRQRLVTQLEAELQSFRAESQQKYAEMEQEISRLKLEKENMLAAEEAGRLELERILARREEALAAKFEAEKAVLEGRAADINEDLQALRQLQLNETLILDNINGAYDEILNSLDAGAFDAAEESAEGLRKILSDPALAAMSAVSARRNTDDRLLSLIGLYISNERSSSSDTELFRNKQLLNLESALSAAEEGRAAFDEGDYKAAAGYYGRALEYYPVFAEASSELLQIEAEGRRPVILPLLERADGLSSAGNHNAASAVYIDAASSAGADSGNFELLKRALDGLAANAEQLMLAETAPLQTETDRLNGEIAELRALYEKEKSRLTAENRELESRINSQITRLTAIISGKEEENRRLQSENQTKSRNLSAASDKNEELTAELGLKEAAIKEREAEIAAIKSDIEKSELSAAERLGRAGEDGYYRGRNEGRSEAFRDILSFTSYLSGEAPSYSDTELKITSLIENESLYAEAVNDITELAAGGFDETRAEPIQLKQSILIGSITFASGAEITVEPLTDLVIENGSEISIMRKERGRPEYYIGSGYITSSGSGKIEARIAAADNAEPARSLDLVYLIITP